jgi:hypothetical protein
VSFGTRCARYHVQSTYHMLSPWQERFLADSEIVEHIVVRPSRPDGKASPSRC